jgi:type II secretory pathway pseudopilin PulG
MPLHRRPHRAFTLAEVLFAVAIVAFSVIGALGAILFIRESLEIDKQRVIALNHARRQVELIRRNLFTNISSQTVVIDNFNTPNDPTDDLTGTLTTRAWDVLPDGQVDAEVTTFPLEERKRVLVEVAVTWNRLGRQSDRTTTEVIRTYVAPR